MNAIELFSDSYWSKVRFEAAVKPWRDSGFSWAQFIHNGSRSFVAVELNIGSGEAPRTKPGNVVGFEAHRLPTSLNLLTFQREEPELSPSTPNPAPSTPEDRYYTAEQKRIDRMFSDYLEARHE